jgi:transcriptional regulator with XRE-family HTH domain
VGLKLSELEQIRDKLGLTLDEMAEAMGVAHSTVHRWESAPSTKSSRKALDEAKALYKRRTKKDWEAQASAPAGGPYVTEKDFAEWRGWWKKGEADVLARLKDLDRRLLAIERKLGISE